MTHTAPHSASSPARHAAPRVGQQIGMAALMLGIVAAIAFGGSLATAPNTDGWYQDVERVAWSPPNWVFGPAWSLLYVLIALAGFLIWRAGYAGPGVPNRARGPLVLFAAQLALNAMWTPFFFAGTPLWGAVAWWIALIDIVLLIGVVIALIVAAKRWSRTAAWVLVPYLGWLLFATSLNAGIIVLN